MVSAIRIKTLEVKIEMRLEVANCVARETKSLSVKAVEFGPSPGQNQ